MWKCVGRVIMARDVNVSVTVLAVVLLQMIDTSVEIIDSREYILD